MRDGQDSLRERGKEVLARLQPSLAPLGRSLAPVAPGLKVAAVLGAIAGLVLLPALILGAPAAPGSAPLNYVWTSQFAENLSNGDIYPRWLPRSFGGLGSPAFYFYPPFAYYLSAGFHLAGAPISHAVALAAFVLLFTSGVAMYAWLRGRTPHALLGAGLYMVAPYHLADFYVRGAFAEFAASMWLPLIALGLQAQPKRWSYPLLAGAFAGLSLTHPPLTVLASCFLIAPMTAWLAISRKNPWLAARTGFCLLIGASLAAIYLVPALLAQSYVNMHALWSEYFRASNWSVLSLSPQVSRIFLAVLASFALPWAILALGARRTIWGLLGLATILLSFGVPRALWMLPVLERVQFPWRTIEIAEFCAITAFALRPPRRAYVKAALALAPFPIANLAAAATLSFSRQLPPEIDRQAPDAIEYLPAGYPSPGIAGASYAPDADFFVRYPGLVNGPAAHVASASNGEITFDATQAGHVVVRRAAFPIWRVTADGREIPQDSGPLIAFDVTPGRYHIARQPLGVERWATAISLGALSVFALLTLSAHPVRRRADALEAESIGNPAQS